MNTAIYPEKLTWNTVTVKNDQEVKLIWNKSKNDEKHFLNYNIYKMEDRNGNGFTYLNTINSITDTIFTDKDVYVDKHSYCYKITNSNECGLESINNDSACSILLKGISEKLVHTLTWQDYNYWTLGTQKFDLLEANDYNRNFVNILPNNTKQFAYQDKAFDYQVGLYFYQIVAHQNQNIGNAISESNTIELMQAPYVFAPNAYTANGDNLNDVWKVEHAFVKEFNLKIYNRWGQLLFETNDKNKPFSLNLTNQLIANDVYVYIINYSGWTGEGNTLKGNFTVLK
jgi:gliding motility-associated-like protein